MQMNVHFSVIHLRQSVNVQFYLQSNCTCTYVQKLPLIFCITLYHLHNDLTEFEKYSMYDDNNYKILLMKLRFIAGKI